MKPLKHSVKKEVIGPRGTYEIDFQDDGQWSVEKIFGGGIPRGQMAVLTGSTVIGMLPTARKAMARARSAAGLPPFEYTGSRPASRPIPDRRGLVAHSRKL